jgi:DNA-binding response OmpR family regulator
LLKLNPTVIEILALLMETSPRTVSPADIAEILWGTRTLGCSNKISIRIHEIRKTIDYNSANPQIHTVHRGGYRLSTDQINYQLSHLKLSPYDLPAKNKRGVRNGLID